MAKERREGIKIIAKNRRAYFNYAIEAKYEAGIVLLGSEVKSIRAGNISLADAFAKFTQDGIPELYLFNTHIAEYPWSNRNNHEPLRPRKLLLHKRELARISQKIDRQGLTIIALSVYFKRDKVKVELGVGRGKKLYDKREALKKKSSQRDLLRGEV